MKCKNLRKKAIAGLNKNNVDLSIVSKETGLGYQWIVKMRQGAIPDPGVNKIEKLLQWQAENK